MTDARAAIPVDHRRRLLEEAQQLVQYSRSIIMQSWCGQFEVDSKPDKSFVTAVDRRAEEALREQIFKRFPDHGIIGEELGSIRLDAEFQWVLDPIDGTVQFLEGLPTFGTIVGLFYQGLPLVGVLDHPALDLCVAGGFGLGVQRNGQTLNRAEAIPQIYSGMRRRMIIAQRANFLRESDEGGRFDALAAAFPDMWIYDSCYAYTCVVCGNADLMVEYNVKHWDLAAAQILVEESGGRYSIVREVQESGNICAVFGEPELVESALELLE